ERIRGADGNRLLAEAAVEAADDLVLPEQLDHGVFHRAVEAHVVVQVKVLLPGQSLRAVCAARLVSRFRHAVSPLIASATSRLKIPEAPTGTRRFPLRFRQLFEQAGAVCRLHWQAQNPAQMSGQRAPHMLLANLALEQLLE